MASKISKIEFLTNDMGCCEPVEKAFNVRDKSIFEPSDFLSNSKTSFCVLKTNSAACLKPFNALPMSFF